MTRSSRGPSPPRSIVVCGGGLAGLSIAGALLDHDFRGELTVLERRSEHTRDRTWCTWATPGALGAFTDAVTHTWPTWSVTAADGTRALHTSRRAPYVHLDPDRVHALGRHRIERASNARLELGVRVLDLDAETGRVRTDVGELDADLVIDALAAGSPTSRSRLRTSQEVSQRFVGWEITTERSVFGTNEASLMDFSALAHDDRDHLRFLYLLPFSPCTALIEDTSIGRHGLSPDVRRAALAEWLDGAGAGSWAITRAERGRIPMSGARRPAVLGARAVAAGEAAGAVRPSSGYAFSRIQRHSEQLARAIVTGTPAPPTISTPRVAALDRIFLRALTDEPSAFPGHFKRLVAGTSAETFARFMTDVPTSQDQARVIAALPKAPFARAALRNAAAR